MRIQGEITMDCEMGLSNCDNVDVQHRVDPYVRELENQTEMIWCCDNCHQSRFDAI